VIKDGIFQARTASKRYADYLGIPPVGDFANVEVAPGVMSKDEIFQGGPILHLCRFSAFEPNGVTGAFSGEIRSGWVVDKGKRTPIKGGAVAGTMQEAFRRAYFSKEIVQRESYKGPAYVKLCGLDIGGE
jgi:PmbA protein